VAKSALYRKNLREVQLVGGTLSWREALRAFAYLLIRGAFCRDQAVVRRFEREFAHVVGAEYAFAFGAGRVALYAILKALGIHETDEVILSGFTCVVVPNSIIYVGAKPTYVDVTRDTWCIDCSQVEKSITPRTKAIIAQHNFGSFCDMARLREIADSRNIPIIEDGAHALGARYQGKPAGRFGIAAFFTTEQSKIISTIMGGLATTNDRAIARELAVLQERAVSLSQREIASLALKTLAQYVLGHPWNYPWGKHLIGVLEERLGPSTTFGETQGLMPPRFLRKMSAFQAAIGLHQMKSLKRNLDRRRAIASAYREIAQKHQLSTNDCLQSSAEPAYIRYAFLVKNRKVWQEAFEGIGIQLGEWFNDPIHPKGASHEAVHYVLGQCPNAEFLAGHMVNLPTHMRVSNGDIAQINALTARLSQEKV
jgi:dTDP-4-amino-4,6-dideoxygalactose transaminase